MISTRLPVILLSFAAILSAQEATTSGATEPQTRAETIEAERRAKAEALGVQGVPRTNPVGDFVEKFVTKGLGVWNGIQVGTHGFSANIGGLAVGSQIAVGPEYTHRFGNYYKPGLIWDTYVVAAGDLSFRMQSGVEMPRLMKGRAFFTSDAYRYEYTRLLYFGPGPDSPESGKTDYSQRESGGEFRGGLVLWPKLRAGFIGNFRAIAVGPGTDPNIPPADRIYNIANARGIDRQTDFLTGGFFVEYEGRDEPGDPHDGMLVSTKFQNVNGSRRALGGFNQYNLEFQYYRPFWNRRRVLAFRAKTAMTTPHENTFVPFYLEPSLGGGDDLRGFSSFRFHDENSMVATIEYRWTLIPVLDMALFTDAGRVYADADQLSLRGMKTDFGFGMRVRSGNTVPVRFDIGFSREGTQFWLVLANIF
jgi:hypothetical protein